MNTEIEHFFNGDIPEENIVRSLEEMNIDELHKYIRSYYLDPNRMSIRWNSRQLLINFILEVRRELIAKFL